MTINELKLGTKFYNSQKSIDINESNEYYKSE